jgi:hypothetical protein
MPLTSIDWIVIAGYLLINLAIGIYYRRRAGGNTEEFFVSGRNVSWWLAGTSMVATTFAADTPLFVSGVIATQGIAGNWIWWTSCLGGMLTVFFFARYWRRAEVLTDVELTEIRYGGRPAAFLRGFKAIYLGLLMNCLILGWVTNAMVSIIAVLLGPLIAQGKVALHAGRSQPHGAVDLYFRADSVYRCIYVDRRAVGRAGDGFVPVHPQDDHGGGAGLGCRGENRRHAGAENPVAGGGRGGAQNRSADFQSAGLLP